MDMFTLMYEQQTVDNKFVASVADVWKRENKKTVLVLENNFESFSQIFFDAGFTVYALYQSILIANEKRKLSKDVTHTVGNVQNLLHYKNESFDCVFAENMTRTIHARQDFAKAINEIHRVLTDKGNLFATVNMNNNGNIFSSFSNYEMAELFRNFEIVYKESKQGGYIINARKSGMSR